MSKLVTETGNQNEQRERDRAKEGDLSCKNNPLQQSVHEHEQVIQHLVRWRTYHTTIYKQSIKPK